MCKLTNLITGSTGIELTETVSYFVPEGTGSWLKSGG